MRKRDPNRIEMGRRFREARERLNWSREVLAERAGSICVLYCGFGAGKHRHPAGELYPPVPPAGFERRLCALRRAPGTLCSGSRICCGPGRRDGPGGGADRGGPCCGPWTNSRQRDDGAPGQTGRAPCCPLWRIQRPRQRRGLCHAFSALDRSARFRRRLAPLRRDLAAGAAGSAVPAGSSASCGALWAGAGSAVSAGFAAARLRRFPGLDAALFSGAGRGRRLLDRRRGEQGLQMLIGQLTLHGAVLPGQGGGQLLPSACPQQERRLETVLNGGGAEPPPGTWRRIVRGGHSWRPHIPCPG